MRKADVVAGTHYAYAANRSRSVPTVDAARVVVERVGPGANATVTLLEAAAGALSEVGTEIYVSTGDLLCTWDEWPNVQAQAATRRRSDEAMRLEMDTRNDVDPNRQVPEEYFFARYSSSADDDEPFTDSVRFAFNGRHRAELPADILACVPRDVRRDVAAAVAVGGIRARRPREEAMSTAVRDVFGGAAWLLAHYPRALHPYDALADHDGDFVTACVAAKAAAGDRLDLPFAPRLREFEHDSVMAPPSVGWMRLAMGYTSGTKLHEPNCSSLRRGGGYRHEPVQSEDTMALWQTKVWETCGTCGGPGFATTPALVAFRAASDVWAAREGSTPEPWQVAALQHLIAQAASQRAHLREPDRLLSAIALDALADERLGDEGWAACALVESRGWRDNEFTRPQLQIVCEIAVRRLRVLATAIPQHLRPAEPAVDIDHYPGSALNRWMREMQDVVNVPTHPLMLSLFELPGAIRPSWM